MSRSRRVALTTVLATVCLAGCSSSGGKSTPTTTTTTEPTTTSTPATTTSTTAVTTTSATPTTTPATVAPTTTPASSSAVRVVSLTGPSSPVDCNALSSQIQLHWVTQHATSVTLEINGQQFATYSNGARDELEPLTCDGTTQTYTLIAHGAGGTTATKSLKLAEHTLT